MARTFPSHRQSHEKQDMFALKHEHDWAGNSGIGYACMERYERDDHVSDRHCARSLRMPYSRGVSVTGAASYREIAAPFRAKLGLLDRSLLSRVR